ncbi:MAG: arginase family protein [Clostridia bacterium]|nr:arginase family protein [Clostridia bacterium]MDY5555616.1 arginase family protein [Blautia sp.]
MKNSEQITIISFSGIYKQEQFWREYKASWVEAQDISGTNCYCDEEALREIDRRTGEIPYDGIHFIDSGNYHYMTRFWIGRITCPFRLIVFDNHTDMQMPAFGNILSCGGWIAASLEELENLKEVVLIGPDEESYSQVQDQLKVKVRFLSREKLKEMTYKEKENFIKGIMEENRMPFYISIDKDVLSPDEADTTWSQGEMTGEELLWWLNKITEFENLTGESWLGMDICGESDPDYTRDNGLNDRMNDLILQEVVRKDS